MSIDEQFCQGIREVLEKANGSPQQRQGMNKLLGLIPKLRGIYRHQDSRIDSQEVFNEALVGVSMDKETVTARHLRRFLQNFELDIDSTEAKVVRQNFVRWFNGILRNNINIQYNAIRTKELSSDAPLNQEGGETFLDTMSDSRRSGDLESFVERIQHEKTRRKGLLMELYIEQDPDRRLRGCYCKDKQGNEYRDCNCQLLFQELYLRSETEPKIPVSDIARRFGIHQQTVYSLLKRRCRKILREIEAEIENNFDDWAKRLQGE